MDLNKNSIYFIPWDNPYLICLVLEIDLFESNTKSEQVYLEFRLYYDYITLADDAENVRNS